MRQDHFFESLMNLLLPLGLILGLVLLLGINVDGDVSAEIETSPLESGLNVIVGYLAVGAEMAAAVVIGCGIVRGIGTYLNQLVSRSRYHIDATENIRLKLGRTLTLGLEFTVASDILRTAVAPTRQDILNLGAIVLLRTLLNYFLEREIRQGEPYRPSTPDQNLQTPMVKEQ